MTRLITLVGGAYSNSYVTLEEANLIASNFPWYDDWNTYSDADKTQALIQAAFAMQQLPWDGEKCSPASDAGIKAIDYDKYLTKGTSGGGGIFDYIDEVGNYTGVDQGDEVIIWGTPGTAIFSGVSSIELDLSQYTNTRYVDVNGTEFAGPSFDPPINIAEIKARYVDNFRPGTTGTINWGVYINDELVTNFPGAKAGQAQRLAWPRSGVTCDGEVADCTYIPETIKITQVIIAYNFLKNPSDVPGTPGSGSGAPTGTYVKRQKIDVLEIEYDQFNTNQYNDDCNNCDDAYLIRTYPWLNDLLGCWLNNSGRSNNRLIRLFRN